MKRKKEDFELTRDNAYYNLERFLLDCAAVRNAEQIDGGYWIVSKDEVEKIHEVLHLLIDCGAEPEF